MVLVRLRYGQAEKFILKARAKAAREVQDLLLSFVDGYKNCAIPVIENPRLPSLEFTVASE